MTKATLEDTRRQLTIADLNTNYGDEPRVVDVTLAANLGMSQPRNIRSKIVENLVELSMHGEVCTETMQTTARGGRPGKSYLLNEPQALLLCMWSNTARAAEVRKLLIDVFMAHRRATLEKPVTVRGHKRRTSTKVDDAVRLKKSIDRIEGLVSRLKPQAPNYCAMVVDGEPVLVDVNDYDVSPGSRAVVVNSDGRMSVSAVDADSYKFKPMGPRSALGVSYALPNGAAARNTVLIVGKVVESHLDSKRQSAVSAITERLSENITTILESGPYNDMQIASKLCCAPSVVRSVRREHSKRIR